MEGQLSKWTNYVRGWQYRWFTLDPDTGMLDYYMVWDGIPVVYNSNTYSLSYANLRLTPRLLSVGTDPRWEAFLILLAWPK